MVISMRRRCFSFEGIGLISSVGSMLRRCSSLGIGVGKLGFGVGSPERLKIGP